MNQLSYWINPFLEVRVSLIHGFGLFAKKTIPKDSVVIVAGGSAVDRAALSSLDLSGTSSSLPVVDDDIWLFTGVSKAQSNTHMNHSCDPNCYFEGQIVWRSLKEITPGDELTCDYSTIADIDATMTENCQCGSCDCRNRITYKDWQLPALQIKYGQRFSSSILRKMGKF